MVQSLAYRMYADKFILVQHRRDGALWCADGPTNGCLHSLVEQSSLHKLHFVEDYWTPAGHLAVENRASSWGHVW